MEQGQLDNQMILGQVTKLKAARVESKNDL
jgi:hypothetical protein